MKIPRVLELFPVFKVTRMFRIGYVYFMMRKEKVVYIGQTYDLCRRVRRHQRESKKKFDGVWAIEIRGENGASLTKRVNELERRLIKALSPEYNKAHKKEST